MTRQEVLQWLSEQLGLKSYQATFDSGAIHRMEWIATAHEFGDWTIDDIKEALRQTEGIRPATVRIYEIHRLLERWKWERYERREKEMKEREDDSGVF